MKKSLLLLFLLVTSIITLNAQLTESFDGTTFPPTGWLSVHEAGPTVAAVWERGTAGTLGGDLDPTTTFTVDPHSGAGMAIFRSYDFSAGNKAHLFTGAVNLSAGGPHLISFWMYRDNTYTNPDSVSVYVNTTQSATGATFLGKILRKRSLNPVEAGANGWYQYSFNIPASFNSATNYFIFSAVSSFGNNLFIDDIAVASQPSCSAPTGINVTGYNYIVGTGTANWTASGSGTVLGYEWAINTTGTPPVAAGTFVAGTTANITGITPNVLNYIYVRTSCGAGGFSSWTSFPLAALPCANLTGPANAATNVPVDQAFSWDAVTGATSYFFFLGVTPGGEVNSGSVPAPTVSSQVGGLAPGQIYYWYVVPAINGILAPNAGCAERSFTIRQAPSNNTCTGAIAIKATNIAGNEVTGTTVGATQSLAQFDCAGSPNSPDDDVWFEFTTSSTTPPSGTLTITPTATGGVFDVVAQVYAAAACVNITATPATCADATTDFAAEVIDLSALLPNTHYYMRVFSWDAGSATNEGAFTIAMSAGNTLPIRLTTFTAHRSNGVNILNWSTEQELNTSYFAVERSKDGQNFTEIARVNAAGFSNTVLNYSYTDNHPVSGNNYYRLRSVDKDNTFSLSDIRALRNESRAAVNIYPNPVKDKLTVSISMDKAVNGILSITDLAGKLVYSKSIQIQEGISTIPVEIGNNAAGTYILKIQSKDDVIIKKFNKQ